MFSGKTPWMVTDTDLQVYFVLKINSMGSWLDNTGTLSIILELVQTF